MRFDIDGVMSNGDGMFTFLRIDLRILKKIMKDQVSFSIANFLIIKNLENSYYLNQVQKAFIICLSEIIEIAPSMTYNTFRYKLQKLRKWGFLDFKKISGDNRWHISLK